MKVPPQGNLDPALKRHAPLPAAQLAALCEVAASCLESQACDRLVAQQLCKTNSGFLAAATTQVCFPLPDNASVMSLPKYNWGLEVTIEPHNSKELYLQSMSILCVSHVVCAHSKQYVALYLCSSYVLCAAGIDGSLLEHYLLCKNPFDAIHSQNLCSSRAIEESVTAACSKDAFKHHMSLERRQASQTYVPS